MSDDPVPWHSHCAYSKMFAQKGYTSRIKNKGTQLRKDLVWTCLIASKLTPRYEAALSEFRCQPHSFVVLVKMFNSTPGGDGVCVILRFTDREGAKSVVLFDDHRSLRLWASAWVEQTGEAAAAQKEPRDEKTGFPPSAAVAVLPQLSFVKPLYQSHPTGSPFCLR